ncbi:MAG: 3-dehydroquinate synthase [Candidatus Shikimatogenerans bostrichidophilus]|nr:MAG: 3-dehydroquinate synthase [Candidatus Shikimatogenerans bostrichidophilus]
MFKIKKKNDYIIINDNFKYLYNFLKKNNFYNIIILLDNNTKKFCLNYIINNLSILKKSKIIEIKNGENHKNIYTCIKIWEKFIKYKIDKNSLLINLGGGVITDLGGLIGCLFKRGIKFINIPTTLLGMIDASIGGKNAINFNNFKNEIGIIKNPVITLIDLFFLKSLPKKEIFSGLGELLKYGLIFNKNFWNIVKNINFKKKIFWVKIIYKAILIKKKIVDQDPEEIFGIRKILNFGHTIGHAIESLFLYKKKYISHGEAISLGMICESWISKKINNLSNKEYKEICNVILKFYKIKKIKKKYYNKIINFIENDKKNYNKKIYFSLLSKIGKCTYNKEVKKKLILISIDKMNKLYK